MGNPHYNTWGGKNNSWGNKNRKGKSGGGGGPVRDDEAWSKGAKVVAAGVCLFVLANTGLGPVIETAQNVMDVFDFKNDVKEYHDTVKSESKGSKNSKSSKANDSKYNSIKNNVDLEASDVSDILEFLHTELTKADAEAMDTDNTTAIFVEYDYFKNDRKYQKNIMEKLEDYSGAVSFIAVHPDYLSDAEMQEEFDRVAKIINGNTKGNNSVFRKIKTNALTNVPRAGSFVVTVTFTE